MKCLNLHGIGDLKFDEKETPSFGDDEVLLEVKYCGVCGSDCRSAAHGKTTQCKFIKICLT